MRIFNWNCNMAFRKKTEAALIFNPDLIVLQENEDPAKFPEEFLELYPNYIFKGQNPNKGIALLAKESFQLSLVPDYTGYHKYIVPIQVESENSSFILFAIWAQDNKKDPHKRYIGQVWLALQKFKSYLRQPSILVGDFNGNSIWDRGKKRSKRVADFTQVVKFLERRDIYSLYHQQTGEAFGEESQLTLALLKNLAKPFHLDYCFVSKEFLLESHIEIGKPEAWLKLSDHMPLIIDLPAIKV